MYIIENQTVSYHAVGAYCAVAADDVYAVVMTTQLGDGRLEAGQGLQLSTLNTLTMLRE